MSPFNYSFIFCLFFFSSLCCSSSNIPKLTSLVPVVYVVFGEIPLYLKINIELAARNNPVVVLTDGSIVGTGTATATASPPQNRQPITIEHLGPYANTGNEFAKHYIHHSPDNSPGRKTHELHCFQRWFILSEYMDAKRLEHAFFGDGDSAVFQNMTEAYLKRQQCAAVINVETQGSNVHWVGAGESSLWTRAAISEFARFTVSVYTTKRDILLIKAHRRPSVVDMSLLWLWWCSHFNATEVRERERVCEREREKER